MTEAPQELRRAAIEIKRRRWEPVSLPLGSKNPARIGWQHERLSEEQIPRVFSDSGNLGILTGEPSNGLVDVDLDALEAIACGDHFLPPTGMVHGRPSKLRSHRWYVVDPAPRITRWKDTDGSCLVELRGTGGHTIVPPSLHPCGETIAWVSYGDPAEVDLRALEGACAKVAVATLLARHWASQGSRHQAALALGGFLLRGGLDKETTVKLIATAARVAGDDEWAARARDVEDSERALAQGRQATGAPTLSNTLKDGDRVVGLLGRWLGLRGAEGIRGIRAGHQHASRTIDAREVVPLLTDLREVRAGEVEWVWQRRVPRGYVSLVTGDPDAGKTYALLDVGASFAEGKVLPGGAACRGPAGCSTWTERMGQRRSSAGFWQGGSPNGTGFN